MDSLPVENICSTGAVEAGTKGFKGFKLLYKYHNTDQFNHENYKYNKTKLVVISKYLDQYYSIKYFLVFCS